MDGNQLKYRQKGQGIMQITGSYNNYLSLSNLLSPLGVKNSGNLVMDVFASSMHNLKNKIDNQIFSKESAAAINQLGNMVSDLSSKAKKLTLTDMHSVFNDRSSISTDSNVLTASAYDALSQNTGAAEHDCLNDTFIKKGLSKKQIILIFNPICLKK